MNKVSKNIQPVAAQGATGYQGKVKIAVFKGKRQIKQQTVKNNGTNSLFMFLCQCLAGTYNRASAPTGIQLKNSADGSITNTISISRAIMSGSNDDPQVTFSFVVPFSAVQGDNQQTPAKLSLVNGGGEVLAQVNLAEDGSITMSKAQADYSLNIDWIMSFDNVTVAS